MFLKSLDIFL